MTRVKGERRGRLIYQTRKVGEDSRKATTEGEKEGRNNENEVDKYSRFKENKIGGSRKFQDNLNRINEREQKDQTKQKATGTRRREMAEDLSITRFFNFRVERNCHTTTKGMKQLEMPTSPMKALSILYSWAVQCLVIPALKSSMVSACISLLHSVHPRYSAVSEECFIC